MSVSFGGIGEEMITFYATSDVAEGMPVAVSANGKVDKAGSAAKFCGVAIKVARDGHALIQTKGYVNLEYSGSTAPTVGYGNLAADGAGKVVPNSAGNSYLIVDVDSTAKRVGFFLN